jgi:hypothetical protein
MADAKTTLLMGTLLLAGCGNTPLTVSGRVLEPQSAVMLQYLGQPFVILSDIPELCDRLRANYQSAGACGATREPFDGLYGAMLTISPYGTTGARTDPLSPTNSAVAAVAFATTGPASTFSTHAITGEVHVDEHRISDFIAGNWDVTFDTGERKQGHFAAHYCDAVEYFNHSIQEPNCGFSKLSNSCTRSCSCGPQTSSASCTQLSNGGWQCSCQRSNGANTTCTMSATPSCGSSSGTCCEMEL